MSIFVSWFVARRLRHNENTASFSSLVMKIAVAGIAGGIAIMVLSVAILQGFRQNVYNKIFSFGGHIQVTKSDPSDAYEAVPVSSYRPVYTDAEKIPGIAHVQRFAYKACILKTQNSMKGLVIKGIGPEFDTTLFSKNIIRGRMIRLYDTTDSKEIIISRKTATELGLDTGATIATFFIQNPPRSRKLTVAGIFETGMEEFDDLFLVGDLKLVQRINNWPDSLVSGFEYLVTDFDNLQSATDSVYEAMDYDMQIESIKDRYVAIFDWLTLLDTNVIIFLIIILIVACVNMISTIIIMITERTSMIGLLRAMGGNQTQVGMVFLFNGLLMILKGMLWGNVAGLGLSALQYYFRIFPLDPENYFISYVPIAWDWTLILGVNLFVVVLVVVMMWLPLLIIRQLKPVRAIKFS